MLTKEKKLATASLFNGDCLELMRDIPDKSVDMILCDLPYGTTACKWDNVIPFEPLWEQYERIITDNGAIVLFGSEPFSSVLRLSNIGLYKYDWIWEKNKTSNFLNARYQPLKIHETISVFGKSATTYTRNGRNMSYFPQGTVKLLKPVLQKGNRGAGGLVTKDVFHSNANKDTIRYIANYPKSVLKFPMINSNRVHSTQKPLSILEYLVKTYTNEGETVLDNCMGSGSTGVACMNTGRNFIGIELDPKYFEIASKRIEEAKNNRE